MKDIAEQFLDGQSDADEYCAVCGDQIPIDEGVVPREDTTYFIVRENTADRIGVMTERWVHDRCIEEYLSSQE
jgi:hypothetical protein